MLSSLSAGLIIRDLLLSSDDVRRYTSKVWPVVAPIGADKAVLPYIVYRRVAMSHVATMQGVPGADTLQMEVNVYSESYEESAALAEAVRGALDYRQGSVEGLVMRSCVLTDSQEGWEDDAYVQSLVFTVKMG